MHLGIYPTEMKPLIHYSILTRIFTVNSNKKIKSPICVSVWMAAKIVLFLYIIRELCKY